MVAGCMTLTLMHVQQKVVMSVRLTLSIVWCHGICALHMHAQRAPAGALGPGPVKCFTFQQAADSFACLPVSSGTIEVLRADCLIPNFAH